MHQVPRGPAKRTRTFARCPLFPLYFCFVSRDVLQRESRPHGPPLFPSTGRRRSFFFPSSTLFILSLSWAWIFVSVLGNLPPSNSVRRGACFVLSLGHRACVQLQVGNETLHNHRTDLIFGGPASLPVARVEREKRLRENKTSGLRGTAGARVPQVPVCG